jgi:hypothetical protein
LKSIAIMQPYFFPYIGYFQLINYVDVMVIYDNIQYTKKGWVNRNKLIDGDQVYNISIPLKKASSKLNINERHLSYQWPKQKVKIIKKITNSYKKSKYFDNTINLIENIFEFNDQRLDNFLFNSIQSLANSLNIKTKIIRSSEIELNSEILKGTDRVIEIIKLLKGKRYVNPISGENLYDKKLFNKKGIRLNFIETSFNMIDNDANTINSHLSIIHQMMNISKNDFKKELMKITIK